MLLQVFHEVLYRKVKLNLILELKEMKFRNISYKITQDHELMFCYFFSLNFLCLDVLNYYTNRSTNCTEKRTAMIHYDCCTFRTSSYVSLWESNPILRRDTYVNKLQEIIHLLFKNNRALKVSSK